MFWVVTAPTPARVKAQRAATAGEDEVTATASWPVLTQRAAREKVMTELSNRVAGVFRGRRGFVKYFILTIWNKKSKPNVCDSR
jgi:hypothetical protein